MAPDHNTVVQQASCDSDNHLLTPMDQQALCSQLLPRTPHTDLGQPGPLLLDLKVLLPND